MRQSEAHQFSLRGLSKVKRQRMKEKRVRSHETVVPVDAAAFRAAAIHEQGVKREADLVKLKLSHAEAVELAELAGGVPPTLPQVRQLSRRRRQEIALKLEEVHNPRHANDVPRIEELVQAWKVERVLPVVEERAHWMKVIKRVRKSGARVQGLAELRKALIAAGIEPNPGPGKFTIPENAIVTRDCTPFSHYAIFGVNRSGKMKVHKRKCELLECPCCHRALKTVAPGVGIHPTRVVDPATRMESYFMASGDAANTIVDTFDPLEDIASGLGCDLVQEKEIPCSSPEVPSPVATSMAVALPTIAVEPSLSECRSELAPIEAKVESPAKECSAKEPSVKDDCPKPVTFKPLPTLDGLHMTVDQSDSMMRSIPGSQTLAQEYFALGPRRLLNRLVDWRKSRTSPVEIRDRIIQYDADSRLVTNRTINVEKAPLVVVDLVYPLGPYSLLHPSVLFLLLLISSANFFVSYVVFRRCPWMLHPAFFGLFTAAHWISVPLFVMWFRSQSRGKRLLTYVPHWVSCTLAEYGPSASVEAIEASLLMRMRRVASLPIPDKDHIGLYHGTALVIKHLLTTDPFFWVGALTVPQENTRSSMHLVPDLTSLAFQWPALKEWIRESSNFVSHRAGSHAGRCFAALIGVLCLATLLYASTAMIQPQFRMGSLLASSETSRFQVRSHMPNLRRSSVTTLLDTYPVPSPSTFKPGSTPPVTAKNESESSPRRMRRYIPKGLL